ncbi:MAG: YggS family pyridoxal phosphate-dependent enzyme [Phycisphaerales bacterium]|nr:YggS family pyridoxal phosphate-dependent enzyme [Phycisphaerales bacterium]
MTIPLSNDLLPRLRENLAAVRGRIADAARRSGRDPADVHLVAVVKSLHIGLLPLLLAEGVRDLGESRVQQLIRRAAVLARMQSPPSNKLAESSPPAPCTPPPLAALPPVSNPPPESAQPLMTGAFAPRWHMIGHLQRNKVADLLKHCTRIHAVDSERLAREIDQRAAQANLPDVDVWIEVNISGEAAKHGIRPSELDALLTVAVSLPHLRLRGLMTMAPFSEDPESARPHFANLRRLRDDVVRRGVVPGSFRELSMGMSGDYEVAVSEGATHVRVGTALGLGLPHATDAP